MRCPFCPTGVREFGRQPGFVDVQHIAGLMNAVGSNLYIAYLYSWGEPLMHPKVAEIIALVRSHNILTDISTHLNIKKTAILDAALDAGLDHLKLSIDGASQEVYERYRVGGRLDLVKENIRHAVSYKRARKLHNLTIEWQYLVFDHNRHEVEAARELAGKLGVDVFRTRPGVVPSYYSKFWGKTSGCHFLYYTVGMQVDGGIVPCCNLYDKADDFAPSPKGDFGELWNEPTFVDARKLFKPARVAELPSDMKHPCLSCALVHAQPHLAHLDAVQRAREPSTAPALTQTIAARADAGR